MPKAVFYGELSQGKRDRGAPRKCFKDQLKRQLTQAGIDHSEWEALAEDREEWRGTIKTATDNFEEGRKTVAAEKRQRRKDYASQPVSDTTFTCPSCSRACRSRVGLHSHQRACRRASTSLFPVIFGPKETAIQTNSDISAASMNTRTSHAKSAKASSLFFNLCICVRSIGRLFTPKPRILRLIFNSRRVFKNQLYFIVEKSNSLAFFQDTFSLNAASLKIKAVISGNSLLFEDIRISSGLLITV